MESKKIKESLLKIAEKVETDTTLEDIYKQLAYLADIEESEEQEAKGEIISQDEVEKVSKQWLM